MKGNLIPNYKIADLPIGTRLLVNCIDDPKEDCWLVCTLEQWPDGSLYLKDASCDGSFTDLTDLDGFMLAYEYHSEDADRLVEKYETEDVEKISPRYIFDSDYKVILDTLNNCFVCLVGTKRPDLLKAKLGELLDLANEAHAARLG